ncbi:MAG: redoxin domain-containing protein, partial [Bryobacteraceae bacterium]
EDKFGTHGQGVIALMRVLIKYERWKQILDPKTFHWGQNPRDNMYKSYCETLAYLGVGNLDGAEAGYSAHERAKDGLKTPGIEWLQETYNIQSLELKGKLALAKGDAFLGLSTLAEAAKREIAMRQAQNDPPFYPTVLYNALGRAYLDRKSPQLAELAFENTLKTVRNDPFALSGLVEASSELGKKQKAREMMGRLLYEWSGADPGLKWIDRARALVPEAKPYDDSPKPERNYKRTSLDRFGPSVWEPYPAPDLDVVDTTGKHVRLDQFRGRNVLLIFYLGDECPHCLEQLIEVGKHKLDFAKAGADILAVSGSTPEHNAELWHEAALPFRLLTDSGHNNASRFHAYDDFEDLELHATILIGKKGRVYWARIGGDPFNNVPFLLKELERMNAQK